MRMKLEEKITKEKSGEEPVVSKKYKFKTETEAFELKVSGAEEDLGEYEDYIEVAIKTEHQAKVSD